jgi:hypothetical protein
VAHLEAVAILDRHPALYVLEGAKSDDSWLRARRYNWEQMEHAQEYWDALSDDERTRRAAPDYAESHLPADPKERSITPDPQECPVCETQGLLAPRWDDYGGENAPGICVACSYVRSEAFADHAAFADWLEYQMNKDD